MIKASLNTTIVLALFGLFLLPNFSVSQNELQRGVRCYAIIENNDTIPVFYLNEVDVTTNMVFKTKRQYEQCTRVKYNVKKVYPYAILASAKLKQYDLILSKMEDEDIRKAYLRVCEKDLRHEFEDELKGLSVSQGRVLMKLINRETGKTTYTIVKELRGSFQASMWQALAKLFGNDMKTEYDSQTEDVMIEKAIAMVERGDF
jgi:Domain of unknown function (DUF4294)